jgi:hypothetical protein
MKTISDFTIIENFLLNRYPRNGPHQDIREEISKACKELIELGLADPNFVKEFTSGSEPKFWQHLSEALLAKKLCNAGLKFETSRGGGPDFLLVENRRKIWIEVVCPEPKGVPSEWLKSESFSVVDFPHESIILRWTSAIKEKVEKLIGSMDGTTKGYIEKRIVSSEDAYVIAVNGCQLRNGTFPELNGISQFPFAVEAVFAIGPYQIKFNRKTLELTDTGYQYRPFILNHNKSDVPADTFLDERYKHISAIWAVDVNGTSAIGNYEPMAVIHNPNAVNPVPVEFLPAHNEYVATPIGDDKYELKRIIGNMNS